MNIFDDPRECELITIQASGYISILLRGDNFSAAWGEELLTGEQLWQLAKDVKETA